VWPTRHLSFAYSLLLNYAQVINYSLYSTELFRRADEFADVDTGIARHSRLPLVSITNTADWQLRFVDEQTMVVVWQAILRVTVAPGCRSTIAGLRLAARAVSSVGISGPALKKTHKITDQRAKRTSVMSVITM